LVLGTERKVTSLRALVLLGLWGYCAWAAADVASDIRNSANAILRAEKQFDSKDYASINLRAEIDLLTKALDAGVLNPVGRAIAYYWRGNAYMLLNWVRLKTEKPADTTLARNALADFDQVLAHGVDIPDWRVSVADTAYSAGLVARNHLDSAEDAYRYWQRCADQGHAGCLNIMASARLTGAGQVQVDLNQSLELNKRVYDTGTDYQCAGAFSALAIAHILYFGRVDQVTVDALEWMRRAYLLLDELAERRKEKNPCERSRFEVHEYLLRLGRGEERPQLLRTALERAEVNEQKILATYLLGTTNEAAFREAAAKNTDKNVSCDMYFIAFWHADVRKDAARSQEYLRLMSTLGADYCRIELALAGLRKTKVESIK
jgi:hypothetical protein